MKTVVLSFDDARSDFYDRVFPVLKRYGIPATLNVISGYVNGNAEVSFPSAAKGMTVDEVVESQQSGLVEIACHGATHVNTRVDVENNIKELVDMGVDVTDIGFASPNSVITISTLNKEGIGDLLNEGKLLYVRSGIQIRREGVLYSALSLIDRYIHNRHLFWRLNKNNVFDNTPSVIPSVAVFSHTSFDQIRHLIQRMPQESNVILMFHSILAQGDDGYGKDRYYWDLKKFESLCSYLNTQKDISICKTSDLLRKNH